MLRVLDGAVVFLCGRPRAAPSETVWPRRKGTAFGGSRSSTRWTVSAQIFTPVSRRSRETRGKRASLVPAIGAEENFSGLVDLVQMNAYYFEDDPADPLGLNPKVGEIPAGMLADTKKYREELIEAVADCDDGIARKYLEGAEIGVNELMVGIRKATVSLKFSGVIPGSALRRASSDCSTALSIPPQPLDLPPSEGQTSDGVEAHTLADDRGKTVGLASSSGAILLSAGSCLSLYQGKLAAAGQSTIAGLAAMSISHLLLMRAMDKEEIDVAYAGDICAVVGVKDAITGDTLCDDDADIRLEPPTFPETVISMSIEPKSKADQEKMGAALQRLSAEDPTFRTFTDTDTGQVIIAEWASFIWRSSGSHVPRIQGRCRRRQTADRLPRKHHRARRGRGQIHPPVRRSRPVRSRRHHARAERKRQRRRGDQRNRGRRGSEGIYQAHHRRILEAANNGVVAGFPVIDFKATSSMVHSTRSTRRNLPSEWPGFLPSRMPWRNPGRFFWSRS